MKPALRVTAILCAGVMPVCLYVLQQVNLFVSTFTTYATPLLISAEDGNAPNVAIVVFAKNDTHSNFYKSIA